MTQYVVDASVVVKWFVPENHSKYADRLLNNSYNLLAPQLLIAEVCNILWKKIRLGQISLAEGQQALAEFQATNLQILELEPLLQDTFNLANQTGRTAYDCFYLILAIQQQCQMVTADEKFFNALQNTAFATHLCWVEDLPEESAKRADQLPGLVSSLFP